jgi:hypothetical protein
MANYIQTHTCIYTNYFLYSSGYASWLVVAETCSPIKLVTPFTHLKSPIKYNNIWYRTLQSSVQLYIEKAPRDKSQETGHIWPIRSKSFLNYNSSFRPMLHGLSYWETRPSITIITAVRPEQKQEAHCDLKLLFRIRTNGNISVWANRPSVEVTSHLHLRSRLKPLWRLPPLIHRSWRRA